MYKKVQSDKSMLYLFLLYHFVFFWLTLFCYAPSNYVKIKPTFIENDGTYEIGCTYYKLNKYLRE